MANAGKVCTAMVQVQPTQAVRVLARHDSRESNNSVMSAGAASHLSHETEFSVLDEDVKQALHETKFDVDYCRSVK